MSGAYNCSRLVFVMDINSILKFKDLLFVSTSDSVIAISNDKVNLARAVMYYGSKDIDFVVVNFIGECALKAKGTVTRYFSESVVNATTSEFLDVLCGMRMRNEVPANISDFSVPFDEVEMLKNELFV